MPWASCPTWTSRSPQVASSVEDVLAMLSIYMPVSRVWYHLSFRKCALFQSMYPHPFCFQRLHPSNEQTNLGWKHVLDCLFQPEKKRIVGCPAVVQCPKSAEFLHYYYYWLILFSAIPCSWADSLCFYRMWFPNEWHSLAGFEYPLKWCTYSAVWLLRGWCRMKLLPSWHVFCVHHTTMHQFTVSLHSKPYA